ncbi:MAG: pirin family protein [Rhodobacterales bacterium]|nr:pirin family protein [Rhodobacterales bacterium]
MTAPADGIALVLEPKAGLVGGLPVKRSLPALARRSVGPFVFIDEMGPAPLPAGRGIDVKPHPHIGLATLTWLIAGRIRHRDSLGFDQVIRPGDVNWMTAGRGIVHSERSPDDDRAADTVLHGLQIWMALPEAHEDAPPAFQHVPADAVPGLDLPGGRLSLVAGRGWGLASPVAVFSPTLYADVTLDAGAELTLPAEHDERAVYALTGDLSVAGQDLPPGHMAVLAPGAEPVARARTPSRFMVLGGAPVEGRRHMWWNFVATSRDRIERAKDDWRAGRFDPVLGDGEREPMPGE